MAARKKEDYFDTATALREAIAVTEVELAEANAWADPERAKNRIAAQDDIIAAAEAEKALIRSRLLQAPTRVKELQRRLARQRDRMVVVQNRKALEKLMALEKQINAGEGA